MRRPRSIVGLSLFGLFSLAWIAFASADVAPIRSGVTTLSEHVPSSLAELGSRLAAPLRAARELVATSFRTSTPDWLSPSPSEDASLELLSASGRTSPHSRPLRVVQGGAALTGPVSAGTSVGAIVLAAADPLSATASGDPLQTTNGASALYSDQFEACRDGVQGGGFDADSGLWAWTCGNYNWHAASDPSQANASYLVDCIGLRKPDRACRREGERLLIGVLHAAGVAADHTVPGGFVFWPLFAGRDHGIYVDRGAGLMSDGTTRARIPAAEQLDVRERIGAARYAATGPSARRHAIQAFGVTHVGEVPGTFELDDSGMPIRRGVWYVTDKGPHPDGDPTTGADLEDGPGLDVEPASAALMVGSQRSFSSFNDLNYCDDESATSPRCRLDESGDAFAGRMHWEYGTMSRLVSITPGTSARMCLSNFVGVNESQTTGTCPGDRRMRCWAPGATTLRSAGGCIWDTDGSGAASPGDFDLSEGVGCQGFVDALEYDDETKGRQLEVGVVFDNCIDDPRSAADCSSEMGNHFRRVSIQNFIAGSCGPDARSFFVGTGRSQAFVPIGSLDQGVDDQIAGFDLASLSSLEPGQSIRVDDELMKVTAVSGISISVVRGFSGTTAAAHPAGAAIFASTTFNGTTSTWPQGYPISGVETVVAVSAAKLLQSPGGFENVSLMPSDPRGSAGCVTGAEAECDGTIGIAFNSGTGFYRNGTILHPTFTGANASFFDGSNLSEQVLVEGLRMYGPTRGGATFDLGENWTIRRSIVESGDPTSEVSPLSTFGDRITIEDSIFRGLTTTSLLKFGLIGPQRGLVLRNNKFIGNGGGGGELINIGTASDFLIEGNEFVGNAGAIPIKLNPVRAIGGTTTTTYLRNGTIRDNLFSGNELLANAGESGSPAGTLDAAKASILIRDDETVTNDSNEITNLAIYGNTMLAMQGPPHGGGVAHEDHACLVWLEQDDEPVSRMEESWPSIAIYSNTLEAGVGGRVVCAGDTDPGYRNASASIDLLTSPFKPVTWSNVVNGEPELGTRDLDAWSFVIDTPATGESFLLTRVADTRAPVRFDCVASGGEGLGLAEVSLEQCVGEGGPCAPIGATVSLTAVGASSADVDFDDRVLEQGSWLKVVSGLIAWASPGTVTCTLGVAR